MYELRQIDNEVHALFADSPVTVLFIFFSPNPTVFFPSLPHLFAPWSRFISFFFFFLRLLYDAVTFHMFINVKRYGPVTRCQLREIIISHSITENACRLQTKLSPRKKSARMTCERGMSERECEGKVKKRGEGAKKRNEPREQCGRNERTEERDAKRARETRTPRTAD